MNKLGIIGCGKMAGAIVAGIYNNGSIAISSLLVNDIDAAQSSRIADTYGAQLSEQITLVQQCDAVLLSVKPQQVAEVLANTYSAWHPGQLLISIAAGIKTNFMQSRLPQGVKVVRVMPNLPALVGHGISAIAAGENVGEDELLQVENLLSVLGNSVRINENKMDAVTAVSGSGPAYIMLLVEAMTEAAVNIGLDWNLSRQLVMTTIAGSIKMLEVTGQHPAELKNQVSSPGGTTVAGLQQLEEKGLRRAFYSAVEKAYQRAVQLGQE